MPSTKATTIVTFTADRNRHVDAVRIDKFTFRKGVPVEVPTEGLDEFLARYPSATFTRETATKARVSEAEAAAAELAPAADAANEPVAEAGPATSPRVAKSVHSAGTTGNATK